MTPKRGVVLLTWRIFVCATVDLESFLLATRRAAINKCTHDGLCWSHLRRLRPPTLRHRPKLHRFVLSPCLLQTCMFSIKTTNRLSGVWALSFKYLLISDISWSAKKSAINRCSLPGNCSAIWSIFTAWRYAKRNTCRRRVSVRPSVCECVSVTLRYCVKTAKRRITRIMPHDSDIL